MIDYSLYNLELDISEKNNLMDDNPTIVEELKVIIETFNSEIKKEKIELGRVEN